MTDELWVLPGNVTDNVPLLERWGFSFKEQCRGTFLARFPKGWRLMRGFFPLQTELLDDKGRVRATITHQSDECMEGASIRLRTRFSVGLLTDESVHSNAIVFFVKDGCRDTICFTSQSYPYSGFSTDANYDYETSYAGQYDRAMDETRIWLDSHYPDWREASAYWD